MFIFEGRELIYKDIGSFQEYAWVYPINIIVIKKK